MQCLEESAVLELAAGAVPAAELPAIERHLDGCASCRRLLTWTIASSGGKAAARSTPALDGRETPGGLGEGERVPGARVGRYVILGKLGAGGMGVVHLAYDPEIDRRIALKLIRADGNGGAAAGELKQRLLREARAMARPTHPDIIAVHDAGEVGDQVFVAMEYIEGGTLRGWLLERRRGQREVVAMFLRVGRALAAAHAAGLVHRDFKPDNVLVGADGRVRVTDFGLARLAEEPAAALPTPAQVARAASSSPGVSSLTLPGAIVGSPAYMAPEQMDGQRADARADVFSFSVALFEALSGARPFAGSTLADLRESIPAGRVDGEAAARLPAWLRRPLLRGMSAAAGDRFPSMEALLAELQRDPRQKVRALGVGAGVAACLIAAVFGAQQWRERRAQLCSGGAARLAGVWDDERRAQVRKAFEASRLPFAADALGSVLAALDARAKSWSAEHRSACEATRVRREQSEELLDRRMACLDRALAEQRSLAELLAAADRKAVARAADAVRALGAPSDCADLERLRAQKPLPSDPSLRAGIAQVEERILRDRALGNLGKFREMRTQAQPTAEAARKTGHKPLIANALTALGYAQALVGDRDQAAATQREAAAVALASGEDAVLAFALYRLMTALGDQREYDEARRIAPLAEAAIERAGLQKRLPGQVALELGTVVRRQGKLEEAIALHRRALDEARLHLGKDHERLASPLHSLASTLCEAGKCADAVPLHREALALAERSNGPRHPRVAQVLTNMIEALVETGQKQEAVGNARRALAIYEANSGPDSPIVAIVLSALGGVLAESGQLAEAEQALLRAIAIYEKAFGPKDPQLASSVFNLGEVQHLRGRHAEAAETLERALRLREPKHSKADVGLARFALARALWDKGDRARALSAAQASLAELAERKAPEAQRWLAERAGR